MSSTVQRTIRTHHWRLVTNSMTWETQLEIWNFWWYSLLLSFFNLFQILRVLNFHVPKPEFFDLTCHYLYVIEKWFHGRPNSDNQAPVTIFKAVAKSSGGKPGLDQIFNFVLVSFLMDSLHRPEIIHFEQKAVAIAVIDLALKVHGAQIPLGCYFLRGKFIKILFKTISVKNHGGKQYARILSMRL